MFELKAVLNSVIKMQADNIFHIYTCPYLKFQQMESILKETVLILQTVGEPMMSRY